jgi:flagellar hook-length control protein FliK
VAKESTSAGTAAATAPSAAAIERPEPAVRSEKKSSTRADAATRDTAAAPVDGGAPVVRAVEPVSNTPAPVVASIAPQLGAAADNAAASATATKATGSATESKPGILALSRVDRSGPGAARGAHRPGQTESTPHVDPARFVSRVARAVQTAQERGGPLQLRLSPPELGAMRLELSVNQGALTATIETVNSNAKQLLIDNLPALRDRLADQNIKIERFDVDVRQDSSGNQQNQAPQDRNQPQGQNSAPRNLSHERRQSAMPALDDSQPVRRTISTTSINVVA